MHAKSSVTIEQSDASGKSVSARDWNAWRWQLRHRLSGADAALALLREKGERPDADALGRVVERFRFGVTPYYLSLVDWSDSADPIRRQCIPDVREDQAVDCYSPDPFEELCAPPAPGVVHRFSDRVLVVATTACAVYCRHCTRKHILDAMPVAADRYDAAVAYIARHPGVREVLVSGGDPLLLDLAVLDDLLGRLLAIPHVDVVRVGTRVPVVLPMRVDESLVAVLKRHRPLWLNTQFNHPRELTHDAVRACGQLVEAGIPVSNQAVLLKGINDNVDVMARLCTDLQRHRIRPYYVFQCDPVAGIAHFRTSGGVGAVMAETLRARLGGLCLPRFVADIPGEPGKTPLVM